MALPLLFLFLAFLVLLQFDASRRFRERMDRFPSRIYSSGLFLHPGWEIPSRGLESRLERLGYRRTRHRSTRPGEFRRGWRSLEIHLREADARGSLSTLRVNIRGGRVASLLDAEDRPVAPFAIGARVLGTFYGDLQEDRIPIRLEQAPWQLQEAILTMEDRRFRLHPGVDPFGILRALLANLHAGRTVQGGSTITQQLAKNLYGGGKRRILRKVFEMFVAMELEYAFTKDEILEAYLNDIYLGQRGSVAISGVAAAAEYYFGKRVEDLTLADSALLAGLIRSPGNYNPRVRPERARERRNLVLRKMEDRRWVSRKRAEEARSAPLGIRRAGPPPARGSFLTDFVRRSLSRAGIGRPLPRAGLRIETSISPGLQEAAEAAVRWGLERLESSYRSLDPGRSGKRLEGCLIALRPEDGSILALVGGRDYRKSQFNRVDQARRQPGSLFKPFVYLTGFQEGAGGGWESFTPATILDDIPLEVVIAGKPWRPRNYDDRFRGEVAVREALERSLNVPTVRAAQWIGLERIVRTARRCGIESRLLAVPSLALGTMEVTPLEIAGAFATIANRGRRIPVSVLRSVTGPGGEIFRPEDHGEGEQVVSPEAAYLVTDILRGVVERGTGRRLREEGYVGVVAGKTGTSDGTRDAWFIGYTPEILALAWVGFDDGSPVGLSGSRAAAPIWAEFMKRAGLDGTSPTFRRPEGIIRASIDPTTGEAATWKCPVTHLESFIRGTEPADPCREHSARAGKEWRWLRRLFD